MVDSSRTLRYWLLAAYFTTMTVVGEAWHLLPGNDFEGRLVYSRSAAGFHDFWADWGGGRSAASSSHPLPSSPVTDFCPICQFLGKARIPASPSTPPPTPPLVEGLVRDETSNSWTPVTGKRDIRGPPGFDTITSAV